MSETPRYQIAIDGPVSAGKSTLSDAVAAHFKILHLDTGAMYRAVALAVLQAGIDPLDQDAVSNLCEQGGARISVRHEAQKQHTLLNGQDVSEAIRMPAVSLAGSTISRYPKIRKYLVSLQRQIAAEHPILMDGRDIGTVVLPDAPVKIFLTASPKTRARRRYQQLLARGLSADYDEVLQQVIQRDHQDQTRAVDPLRKAEDAVLLDTSNLSFEQSVQAIIDIVEAHYGKSS